MMDLQNAFPSSWISPLLLSGWEASEQAMMSTILGEMEKGASLSLKGLLLSD